MAREMKDSGIPWIGEIPLDWDVSTLGKFISIDSGISVGKKYEPETPLVEVPYLRVANVQGDHLDLSDVATIWVTPEEAEKYRLKPGQLLMTEGGDRDKLGRGCLWNGEIEGCIHQNHVFAVQTDNRLLVRYLDYLTTSEVARIYFDVTAKKTTNLACTSKSMIQRFAIPIPKVSEQEAIVAYLDMRCVEIDAVLAKIRTSIEEYKKLKQAIITQAVTKGIRGDRSMKESGIEYIGKIPADWEICRLRNIGYVQNGISKSGNFFGSGFPFVSYGDVYKNMSLPFEVKGLVESDDEERERYSVKAGDIFFTRTSETINEVGLSSVCLQSIPNATFAGFLIRVRPFHEELDIRFSKYYFRSRHHRTYFAKKMNLVTRASLGQDLLKSLPVLIPTKQEQISIADYLDNKCSQIDSLINKKEQILVNLSSYKMSLIYECITGRR